MGKQSADPVGLGEKYSGATKRIVNKDGTFNVEKKGSSFSYRDAYQYLINISWTKFFVFILLFYLCVNLIFAALYFFGGSEYLVEIRNGSNADNFFNAFFFSVQTLTTVGYGKIAPVGFYANIIASIEAMTGLLFFALITGLLYGRFSRPSTRILYSKNAIVAPYKNINALMFKIANQRRNNLMELEASMLLVLFNKTGNNYNRQYFNLKLERTGVYFFPLTWTIVHPIDDDSPFKDLKQEELKSLAGEILILIKGFDDTFSQTVHSRFSYTMDEIVWGAKFLPSFYTEDNGEIIFNLNDVHKFDHAELNP